MTTTPINVLLGQEHPSHGPDWDYEQCKLTRRDEWELTKNEWECPQGARYMRRSARTCMECGRECKRCSEIILVHYNKDYEAIWCNQVQGYCLECYQNWSRVIKKYHVLLSYHIVESLQHYNRRAH